MIRIQCVDGGNTLVVNNTSLEDERVSICTDLYKGAFEAYRTVDEREAEYVDKYIDNETHIIYNAPGNSETFFISRYK